MEIIDKGIWKEGEGESYIKNAFSPPHNFYFYTLDKDIDSFSPKDQVLKEICEHKGFAVLSESKVILFNFKKPENFESLDFIRAFFEDLWLETNISIFGNIEETGNWFSIYCNNLPVSSAFLNINEDICYGLFLVPLLPNNTHIISSLSLEKFLLRLKGFLRDVKIY